MNRERVLYFLPYFVSIVFVLVGLPLAFGLVEPNGFYGIRIPRTLESPDVWYAVNADGGIWMTVSGLLSALLVFLLHRYWGKNKEIKLVVPAFLPVAMVLISLAITLGST